MVQLFFAGVINYFGFSKTCVSTFFGGVFNIAFFILRYSIFNSLFLTIDRLFPYDLV